METYVSVITVNEFGSYTGALYQNFSFCLYRLYAYGQGNLQCQLALRYDKINKICARYAHARARKHSFLQERSLVELCIKSADWIATRRPAITHYALPNRHGVLHSTTEVPMGKVLHETWIVLYEDPYLSHLRDILSLFIRPLAVEWYTHFFISNCFISKAVLGKAKI